MWWQVLPALSLTGAFALFPFIGLPVVQYLCTDRPTMRALVEAMHIDHISRHGYRRDFWMCGNEFESRGLENIKDEDDSKE